MGEVITRDVFWAALEWPGLEHLRLEHGPDGVVAVAALTGRQDDTDYRLRYRVECDAEWRTRSASVDIVAGGRERSIRLTADADGTWTDGDGRRLTQVGGAIDVDIAATPFTNTLPIRRLALAGRDGGDVGAAWIRVPSLVVERLDQRYTLVHRGGAGVAARADMATGGAARWRYESPAHAFSAELNVDADGIVFDDPPFFERAWPPPAARAGLLLVASFLIEHDGRLLLVRRSTAKDHAPGEWETGSGRIEPGESPSAAVVREAKEETGFDVDVVGPIDTFRYQRGEARVPALGLAFHCRVTGGELRLSGEHDDARWVRLDRAVDEPLHGLFRTSIERLLATRLGAG